MDYRQTSQTKKAYKKTDTFERQELKRLVFALAVFLAVFLGKKIYPQKILQVGQQVLAVVGQSIDFDTAFTNLGKTLQTDGSPLEGLESFCIEVFGPQSQKISAQTQQDSCKLRPEITLQKTGLLTGIQETAVMYSSHTVPASSKDQTVPDVPEAIPAVGTVLTVGEEDQELPVGYTADQLSFGALETVVPVYGSLNSGFGYRDHPVNGKYLFHGGVDISANAGDPIAAFASGTVDYIGKDDSYGLYLQLDHGDGIKSFYAHCQKLCVQKGQQVTAGETIALVGATGTATGPHLHLELKCGELRVDPAYYVEFLSS